MKNGNIFILIPSELKSDFLGYSFLAKLAGEMLFFSKQSISIDFQNCVLFEGNLCSVLGNIFESMIDRGNNLKFLNLKNSILRSLSTNGFLERFEYKFITPKYSTQSVKFQKFNLVDEAVAKEFFDQSLFQKAGMPLMSEAAKKAILRNIFEVCINAITHAGCEYVYCCGQFFTGNKKPSAKISFVDLGKTITANVSYFKQKSFTGNDAIIWALAQGNTTKAKDEPGGLGLKLLQEFILHNKGKLQFVSGNGFVEINNNKISQFTLDYDFPGTIVTIELKLEDPNFYILTLENEDTTNIF